MSDSPQGRARPNPPAGTAASPAGVEQVEHPPPGALAPHDVSDPASNVPTRVSRNVRWNFAGQFWTLLVTIIATPIVVQRLGTAAYGIIATLAVVTNYMAFLDLGLSQGTTKFIAAFTAEGRRDRVKAMFWTSVAAYMALGLLAVAAMIAVTPLAVSRWFQIPAELQNAAAAAFYVGSFGVLLLLVNFGPTSLLRGLERFDLVNKVSMLVGTLQPLFTLGLVVAGASLPMIVAGSVTVLLGAVLLNFGIARRHMDGFDRPAWDSSSFRQLARFGGYLAAASALVPLAVNAEKLLLASYVSVSALTYYIIPQSIVARLAIIPAAFSSALFPTFSRLHTAGQSADNARLATEVAKTLVYMFAPIVVVLVLFGPIGLALWLGEGFARESATALQILVLAAFVHAFAWTPHMLIQALGRTDVTLRVYALQLAVYLPIAVLAVREWGVNGAAIAWLFRVTLDTVLVGYFIRRLAGFRVRKVLRGAAVPGALVGVALVCLSRAAAGGPALVLAVAGSAIVAVSVALPLAHTIRRLASGGFGAELT